MNGSEGSMNARARRMNGRERMTNGCGRTIAWQLRGAFNGLHGTGEYSSECRGIDRADMNAAGSVGRRQSSLMSKVLLYSHAHGDALAHTGTHPHIRGRIRSEMVEMEGSERYFQWDR